MPELNIRKRNDKWEYRFETAQMNGKRKQVSKGGFPKKSDCLKAGTSALNKYNNTGLHFKVAEISLSDYLDLWYKDYVTTMKKSTQNTYKGIINNKIKPFLGQYKLKSITTLAIQNFINEYAKQDISKNTLKLTIAVLKKSLKTAKNPYGFIEANPCDGIIMPIIKKNAKAQEIITQNKYKEMLEKADKTWMYYLLVLGYHTGARIGEISALTWQDINFDNQSITINKTLYYNSSEKEGSSFYLNSPKTATSKRTIYASQQLFAELKKLKKETSENKLKYAEYYTEYIKQGEILEETQRSENTPKIDFIIRHPNGKLIPRPGEHLKRTYKEENFHFHTLRHTHATMLLEAGVNIKEIQKRLGHANISTTLDIYTKSTEQSAKETVSIFEKILL